MNVNANTNDKVLMSQELFDSLSDDTQAGLIIYIDKMVEISKLAEVMTEEEYQRTAELVEGAHTFVNAHNNVQEDNMETENKDQFGFEDFNSRVDAYNSRKYKKAGLALKLAEAEDRIAELEQMLVEKQKRTANTATKEERSHLHNVIWTLHAACMWDKLDEKGQQWVRDNADRIVVERHNTNKRQVRMSFQRDYYVGLSGKGRAACTRFLNSVIKCAKDKNVRAEFDKGAVLYL